MSFEAFMNCYGNVKIGKIFNSLEANFLVSNFQELTYLLCIPNNNPEKLHSPTTPRLNLQCNLLHRRNLINSAQKYSRNLIITHLTIPPDLLPPWLLYSLPSEKRRRRLLNAIGWRTTSAPDKKFRKFLHAMASHILSLNQMT